MGLPLLAACGGDDTGTESTGGTTTSAGATADGGGRGGGGDAGGFATTADVPEGGGAIFADQGVVVTQPSAGEFKGFTNICTHRQCPLAAVTDTINCNCHGSRFSIEDGSPVNGPATAAAGRDGDHRRRGRDLPGLSRPLGSVDQGGGAGVAEPLVAATSPAVEPGVHEHPRVVVPPGAEQGADPGLLDHLALGVAAADPPQVGVQAAQRVGGGRAADRAPAG